MKKKKKRVYTVPVYYNLIVVSSLKLNCSLATLRDRSFAAAAAASQLWNALPYAIRSSPSEASFRKTLKTFYFRKLFLEFYVLFDLVFSRFYVVFLRFK